MSGVWVFKNGVVHLEQGQGAAAGGGGGRRGKALLYVPENEVVASMEALERRLAALGWERYYEDGATVQLHKRGGGIDLISLPRDFARLRSTHMYDVVLKNRNHFRVVDL